MQQATGYREHGLNMLLEAPRALLTSVPSVFKKGATGTPAALLCNRQIHPKKFYLFAEKI